MIVFNFKFDAQETDSWRYLQREINKQNLVRDSTFATQNDYWKFINQVVLKPKRHFGNDINKIQLPAK